MLKVLSALKLAPILLSLFISPIDASPKGAVIDTKHEFTLVMPYKAPIKKHKSKGSLEFLGFKLQNALNTNIHSSLKEALLDYTGPKIKINSLRRHWGTKSAHEHGKAVDFEFSHELIVWLVSEEGKAWRDKHGFTFYIEDRPGRALLVPYKSNELYSEFVYENRHATGPHIHLNM